jgi:tripartite-type tricarboxylate transporter receptor subunit TctC
MLAQKLTEAWQVQVIVDNRVGAGGTIGLAVAAKAPPDGYTIVLSRPATWRLRRASIPGSVTMP